MTCATTCVSTQPNANVKALPRGEPLSYEKMIQQVMDTLEKQQAAFEAESARLAAVLAERSASVERCKQLIARTRRDQDRDIAVRMQHYAAELARVDREHAAKLKKLEKKHQHSLQASWVEATLVDFEQAQHMHPVTPPPTPCDDGDECVSPTLPTPSTSNPLLAINPKNNPYLCQKYMPKDAVSWPMPPART